MGIKVTLLLLNCTYINYRSNRLPGRDFNSIKAFGHSKLFDAKELGQRFSSHWKNSYSIFLSILNQMEFHFVQYRKENCHHDHIPFNVKGNGIRVFSVRKMTVIWWSSSDPFETQGPTPIETPPRLPPISIIYSQKLKTRLSPTVWNWLLANLFPSTDV